MGQSRELNQVTVIQGAMNAYQGFTSGEKKYFTDNMVDWIAEDKTLKLLITKFSELSLDVKPFLKQNGLLV